MVTCDLSKNRKKCADFESGVRFVKKSYCKAFLHEKPQNSTKNPGNKFTAPLLGNVRYQTAHHSNDIHLFDHPGF